MASSRLEKLLNAGKFLVPAELRPLRHYNENSFIAELDFLDKIPGLSIPNELFAHLGGRYSRVDLKKHLDLIDWIRAKPGHSWFSHALYPHWRLYTLDCRVSRTATSLSLSWGLKRIVLAL